MKASPVYSALPVDSFFTSDKTFQDVMAYFLQTAEKDRLTAVCQSWETHIPSWQVLANEAAHVEKLPRLERLDRNGQPVERVVVPLETRLFRHRVVEAGIFHNKSEFEKFAKVYLTAQLGESGVMCPLACTDGLARVLAAKGSDVLKDKYLDRVLSAETPLAGAQFVTERHAGSDVGQIETLARRDGPGQFKVYGDKWFCSTPEEYFVVAARTEDAEPGTKGISLFLVPRMIPSDQKEGPDYVPNHFTFNRLKDKLGTQSLPTAEITFNGSVAHAIGPESEGFANLMNYVINCSRIHNAGNALGIHRRAFAEARHYALQRQAFGQPLMKQPLIGEILVRLLSTLTAKQVLYGSLLSHVDQYGWLPNSNENLYWQRFLINLGKYRTSRDLTERVRDAILVFGGNGIVNDFSVVPRLLRDALVLETWEGTHNTLCLQMVRDIHKFDFFARMQQEIETVLEEWPDDVLRDSKRFYARIYEKGQNFFVAKNLYNPQWESTHARRFIDHFADLYELGTMVRMGVALDNCNILIQASYLMHERFGDHFAGFISPTLDNLAGICQDLMRELPIDIDVQ